MSPLSSFPLSRAPSFSRQKEHLVLRIFITHLHFNRQEQAESGELYRKQNILKRRGAPKERGERGREREALLQS